LFAVAPDQEQSYCALDFADRNQRDAVRVTVKPNESKMISMKPATAQREGIPLATT
jgi:hypothetical protein